MSEQRDVEPGCGLGLIFMVLFLFLGAISADLGRIATALEKLAANEARR